MRLIDADALMTELIDSDLDHLQRDDWKEVIQIVADAPTVTPEPHWIPVTERLPEKGNTSYLATLDYGEYGMAAGQRFFFGDNIGWNDEAVIAWMPLPEPYKGVME